jgi:hypothetical protein
MLTCLIAPWTNARGDLLTTSYPNAPFNSGGGNAVIGMHHSGDFFGDGTTTKKYLDTLQPYNPISFAAITNFLTNIFNNKDDFGHQFGNTYSLVYVPFTGMNELTVKSYSTFATTGGPVGADMYVSYTQTDKKDPAANTIQWLQVLKDNWSIVTGTGQPGVNETLVDVTMASKSPFYNDSYDANIGSTYLFDRPGRLSTDLATYNGAFPLTWTAQTFAVVDTKMNDMNGKDVIDVYGGFQWGWQVVRTPEPSTLITGIMGFIVFVGVAARNRTALRI